MNKSKKHEQNLRRAERAARKAELTNMVNNEYARWATEKLTLDQTDRAIYNKASVAHSDCISNLVDQMVQLQFPDFDATV